MKTKLALFTAMTAVLGGLALQAQDPAPPPPPREGAPGGPSGGPPGGPGSQGGDPQARLEEFMKKIDTNGDGKISKEEFLAFEKGQSDEKFAKMDANGDGVIDKAELEEAGKKLRAARGSMRGGEGQGGPPGGQPNSGGFRRPEGGGDRGGFRRPEGGDGGTRQRPSGEGQPGGPPPGGESGMRRPEGGPGGGMLQGMLERMDKNGDGAISKEEWMSANEERFKQMDLNGDGKITKEEAEEAGKKMREMMGGMRGGSPGQGGFRRPEGGSGGEGGTRPRPEGAPPQRPEGDAPKPKEGA